MWKMSTMHWLFGAYALIWSLVFFQCGASTTTPTQETTADTDAGITQEYRNPEPNPTEPTAPDAQSQEAKPTEKLPEVSIPPKKLPEETSLSPSQFPVPAKLAASNHDFTSKHFSGSNNCANCHNGLTDQAGNDVSIVDAWSSTMMANAARDPLWQAKVETEIQRNPQHKALIAEKCTRCHAPMANHEAKSAGQTLDMFGTTGILNPTQASFHQAMDGVSCTACHQIKPTTAMGTLAGFSGKYVIETFADPVDRKIYGPYNNVEPMPMRNMVSYTPTGSSHIQESKLCASCHNLKTPFVDSKGTIIPKTPEQEFPEQMVYSEWLHSQYSKGPQTRSCQNCHMPNATGVIIASRPPWLSTVRSTFGQHIFVGANLFMLQLMKDNRDLLGITANNFDFTMQQTKQMLASAARLDIVQKSYSQGTLEFRVKVTNLSGHKLPSGYPARRVYLHVVVKDQSGAIVFESGKMKAYGEIAEVDADQNAASYERHHNVITAASQVQVYEAIMGDTDGKVTYTLLHGARYLKDNRLLPHGFDKNTAPSDIAVVGDAKGDTDFVAGQDEVTYRIGSLKATKLQVEVTLRYQTMSYRFLRDLLRDPRGEYAKKFGYLYLKAPQYSAPITTTNFSF